MKKFAAVVLMFAAVPVLAFGAAKPCEELKADIAKKMDANGVKAYTLDIVAKDKEGEGKVVGTCDGGKSKIVYTKTAPAKAEAKK